MEEIALKNQKVFEILHDIAEKDESLEEKIKIYSFMAQAYEINTTFSYSDKRLEDGVKNISNKLIKNNNISYIKDSVLHIMTEAIFVGGHTRVVDNWIKIQTNKRHSIWIDEKNYEFPRFLNESIEKSGGKIYWSKEGTLAEKSQQLFDLGSQFEYVILHHHPRDILPLLAFGTRYQKRPILFYNMADHLWGSGYSIADALLELTTFGSEFSNKYRGVEREKSYLVGIPVEIKENRNVANVDNYHVISMAHSSKYRSIPTLSFQNFIDLLLMKNEKIKFSIIGVEESDIEWKGLKQKYGNRLNLLGVLKKDAAHQKLTESSVYVNSFPFASYTCVIEAISLGIPAVSLKTPVNDLDSYVKWSCSSMGDLVEYINEIIQGDDAKKVQLCKEQLTSIRSWHSYENFLQNIEVIMSKHQSHIPIKLGVNIIDARIKEFSAFMGHLYRQYSFIAPEFRLQKLSWKTQKAFLNSLIQNSLVDHVTNWAKTYNIQNIIEGEFFNTQLFYTSAQNEEFLGERCITQKMEFDEAISFDLSKTSYIDKLRLDPLNFPARAKFIKAQAKLKNGDIFSLVLSSHNGIEENDGINFSHGDSQMIFDVPQEIKDKIESVEFSIEVVPYNKHEVSNMLTVKSQELTNIYNSKGWKVSQFMLNVARKLKIVK